MDTNKHPCADFGDGVPGFSFQSSRCLGIEQLCCMASICLTVWETSQTVFHRMLHLLPFPPAKVSVLLLHTLLSTWYHVFLLLATLIKVWSSISCGFYLHFLAKCWCWTYFHMLACHPYIFFDVIFFKYFSPFCTKPGCFLLHFQIWFASVSS